MIIDTHVHYNLEPLAAKWQEHWRQAQIHQVNKSVVVGTNYDSSSLAIKIAQADDNLFATVGCHPHDLENFDIEKMFELAKQEKVIAIGEIGLDYFRLDNSSPEIINAQQQAFIDQINLANELNLPISIHVRDDGEKAYFDTLKIINDHPIKNNFVLHCVSGPENYIKQMIDLGAWFGFDGNITYKNAESLRDILRLVPPNKVVTETDAPYLPPVPHRGQMCEPWMIELTTSYIEENFSLTQDQLKLNAEKLFPLLSPYQPAS